MELQKREEIFENLTELGKMCKGCINDLETETKQPLVIRYIKLDNEIESNFDNAISKHTTRCLDFAYSALKSLLCAKYTSDNVTLYYKNDKLKLIYCVDDTIITATI